MEGNSIVFYYLSASEIWPDMRGGLWRGTPVIIWYITTFHLNNYCIKETLVYPFSMVNLRLLLISLNIFIQS